MAFAGVRRRRPRNGKGGIERTAAARERASNAAATIRGRTWCRLSPTRVRGVGAREVIGGGIDVAVQ